MKTNCPFFARAVILILLGACLTVTLALGQSANDGFDPQPNGPIYAIAVQTDGKILIGGTFTSVGGLPRTNLARLNVDGSVDTTFAPGASVIHPFVDPSVSCFAQQRDGKILVGGFFTTLGGQSRSNLARLHPDGSVDLTFNPGADNFVFSLAEQADGRIVVGGYFRSLAGQPHHRLGRLHADGTPDASFESGTDNDGSSTVEALLIDRGGRILVAGRFSMLDGQPRNNLGRLNTDGSLDTGFNPGADGPIRSLAVQVDGKILVGGFFTTLGGEPRHLFGRLNNDGSVDSLDAHINPQSAGFVDGLALQADGKILIGGVFDTVSGQRRNYLARLNSDGSLDAQFEAEAQSTVTMLALQADGNILVGGHFTTLAGENRNFLGRLYPDGSLDATLNPGADLMVGSMVVQADGKIVVGGSFTALGGQPRNRIGRLNPDGSLDLAFNPGVNGVANTKYVQQDGKIIVAGFFTELAGQPRQWIGRLNADGTLDTSFNATVNSLIDSMTVQEDGKVIVAGPFRTLNGQTRNWIGRLHPDGSLDTSFNPVADNAVRSLALQPDGKIVVAGYFSTLGGLPRSLIGRLNPDGSVDESFNPGAGGTDGSFTPPGVEALALQPDGKILVGGWFITLGGQPRKFLGRLYSNGTLDAGFNPGGPDRMFGLTLHVDGKILVWGDNFDSVGGYPRASIARLNPDGTVDESFNPGYGDPITTPSYTPGPWACAIQADGKILVGGNFRVLAGQPRNFIGRLSSSSPAVESLAVNNSTVTWSRNGSGPEVERVVFERSADGTNYAMLGNAARISGGWQLANSSFPVGQVFFIRARGHSRCGFYNGSGGLIESVAQFWRLPPPFISSVEVLGNGLFQFSFTNTNAVPFSVLASSDVAAPSPSWENLGAPVPVGNGLYQFNDPGATNHARRFYQLHTP